MVGLVRGSIWFWFFMAILLWMDCFCCSKSPNTKKTIFRKDDYKLFIIAGTQKSGTTVLSGLLAEHPLIAFSKKKELHFYDKDANYEKGLNHYLKGFSPKENSTYIGESTPFYVASRVACERIAEDFPTAKLIVMLREPVERAYSEYQMKLRRVGKQNELFQMLQQNISQIRSCFANHNDTTELKNASCIPKHILEHVTLKKILIAINKSLSKNVSWSNIVDRCFPFKSYEIQSFANSSHPCLLLPANVQQHCYGSSSAVQQGFIWMKHDGMLEREYFNISKYRKHFEEKSYVWDPKACFQDHRSGYEQVKPLYSALVDEMEEFERCAQIRNFSCDVPLLQGIPRDDEEEDMFNESLEWTLQRLEEVDEAVDQCIRVKGGISSQYIYRSMYAVQLYNCFLSFEPDQFLIIPSGDMRQNSVDVLQRVLEFLDLPVDNNWIQNVTSRSAEVVSERYQDFAKTTSWQLLSNYEPLDDIVRQSLSDFFQFHNELLFRLLGEDFTGRW